MAKVKESPYNCIKIKQVMHAQTFFSQGYQYEKGEGHVTFG
jgi:hypothetical protein